MKTRLLITFGIFLVIISAVNHVHGWWIPLSPEELIEQSETIFVGTITDVTPVEIEYQSQIARNGTIKDSVGPEVITLEEYTVDVEEYLKNPQESDTITVLRATVGGVPSGPAKISGFEVGERVLFYLPKDEKQTHFSGQYLPESFKIPEQCDAKSVLEQQRIIGANDFRVVQYGIATETNFTANKSIHFIFNKDMRTLDGAGFDVTVTIAKTNEDKTRDVVLSKTVHAESKPCEWIASTELEFVPTAGEYYRTVQITQGTSEEGYSGPFLVVEGSSETAKDSPCFNIEENRHAPCNPDESIKFYDYMGEAWMESKKQEMLDAFQADRFHEWIDKTENYFHWNVYQYYSYTEDLTKFLVYPPPFKQLSLGILPQDINCKTGLFLIQKHDGTPVCVSPETKQKLIERGWRKSDLQKPKDSSDTTVRCQGSKLCLTEEVTRIIDGDTIYLTGGYKVRLSLTNTPEINESGFYEASQFTANMCPVGSRVMVDQDDLQPYDVYNRLLGKVVCDNKVLNAELLYNGHANILTRYCSASEFSNESWAQEFGC